MNYISFHDAYSRGLVSAGDKVFVIWENDKHISERYNLREAIIIESAYEKFIRCIVGDRIANIHHNNIYLNERDYYLSGFSDKGKSTLSRELDYEAQFFLDAGYDMALDDEPHKKFFD